jgi:hypothetical protein
MMNWLFRSPSLDDLIRLLKAWRFWVLGAVLGGGLGFAFFTLLPPPYRAQATVNVDFNMEDAWPDDVDRQQFYYLEREARKLVEIAWSDTVIQKVSDSDGNVTIRELRDGRLMLSQPREAGWHFFAEDPDRERAVALASIWAQAFVEQVEVDLASESGVDSFIRVEASQVTNLPVERRNPLSAYLFTGAVGLTFLAVLVVLFFDFEHRA